MQTHLQKTIMLTVASEVNLSEAASSLAVHVIFLPLSSLCKGPIVRLLPVPVKAPYQVYCMVD